MKHWKVVECPDCGRECRAWEVPRYGWRLESHDPCSRDGTVYVHVLNE